MIDMLFAGEPKKIESVRIETPMGAIESDSGNHMVDVASVVIVIIGFYVGLKLFRKWIKRF